MQLSWLQNDAEKELQRLDDLRKSMQVDDWEAFHGFYYRLLLKKTGVQNDRRKNYSNKRSAWHRQNS